MFTKTLIISAKENFQKLEVKNPSPAKMAITKKATKGIIQERNITLPEIIYVLTNGRHEKNKDHFDEVFNAWNYAVRGWTLDKLDLRVIISFDNERDLLIIIAFYLKGRN